MTIIMYNVKRIQKGSICESDEQEQAAAHREKSFGRGPFP